MEGFVLPTDGKDEGYVRHVIGVPQERSGPINHLVHTAARTNNRSASYIAEVLKQATDICQTPAEIVYAAYVVGCVLGTSDES